MDSGPATSPVLSRASPTGGARWLRGHHCPSGTSGQSQGGGQRGLALRVPRGALWSGLSSRHSCPGPSGGVEINCAPESEQSPRSELARAGAASAPPLEFGRDSVAGGWEAVAATHGLRAEAAAGDRGGGPGAGAPFRHPGPRLAVLACARGGRGCGSGRRSRGVWPGHALCGHVPRPQRHTLSWPDPLASQV